MESLQWRLGSESRAFMLCCRIAVILDQSESIEAHNKGELMHDA
jgi:hypothetical protein